MIYFNILIFIILLICICLLNNPVQCLLSLILIFINFAIFLFMQNFIFLGLAYILVYIGAICVLFLYIILLIHTRTFTVIYKINLIGLISMIIISLITITTYNLKVYKDVSFSNLTNELSLLASFSFQSHFIYMLIAMVLLLFGLILSIFLSVRYVTLNFILSTQKISIFPSFNLFISDLYLVIFKYSHFSSNQLITQFLLPSFILIFEIGLDMESIIIYIFTSVITYVLLILFNLIEKIHYFYFFNKLKATLKKVLDNKIFEPFFRLIYFYISYLFILRLYFSKERLWLAYIMGLVPVILSLGLNIIPYIISLKYSAIFSLYLLSVDNTGDIFSSYLRDNPKTSFSLGYQTFLYFHIHHKNVLIRKVSYFTQIGSTVYGLTKLSMTGRITLATSAIGGIGYLWNENRNRALQQKNLEVQQKNLEVQQKNLKLERVKTASNTPHLAEMIFDGDPEELASFNAAQIRKAWVDYDQAHKTYVSKPLFDRSKPPIPPTDPRPVSPKS